MPSERALAVLRWIDNPRHAGVVACPFPLDTGEIISLRLPVDLLRSEADRLAAMLRAWCPDA